MLPSPVRARAMSDGPHDRTCMAIKEHIHRWNGAKQGGSKGNKYLDLSLALSIFNIYS